MAQTSVVSFYNTRKRFADIKKETNKLTETQINHEDEQKPRKTLLNSQISQYAEDKEDSEDVILAKLSTSVPKPKKKTISKKGNARSKDLKTSQVAKKGKTSQTKVTKFYQSVNSTTIDESEVSSLKNQKIKEGKDSVMKCSSIPEEVIKIKNKPTLVNTEQSASCDKDYSEAKRSLVEVSECRKNLNVDSIKHGNVHSPKRHLPIPVELTPSKKKPHTYASEGESSSKVLASKGKKDAPACRKLVELAKPEKVIKIKNKLTLVKAEQSASCDKDYSEAKRSSVEVSECRKNLNVDSIKHGDVHSPKRHLPIPVELTPSKKKPHTSTSEGESSSKVLISKSKKDAPACRKLDLGFPSSPSKASSSLRSPVKNQVQSPRKILSPKEKVNAMIEQSRARLLLSPKLDELRKSLENFSKKTSMIKEYQSNPFKLTSVVSKSNSNTLPLPSTPAHERFSHLVAPDPPSLVLPFKFKLLAEMFRSADTVVSILHNRKEKITLDKVCDGVQKIMKRNFSKTHLGQIVAVLPSAYSFTIEKCNFMNKKADSKDYQLIISPTLAAQGKKSKSVAFQPMNPQCLIDRRSDFNDALLKITKQHHQDFLTRLRFPSVPEEILKRWHPKFPVDSVPDIQPAQLPEPQESKVYSAKDVLNKVKGTFMNRVEKALQSVSDESNKDVTLELKEASASRPETSKAALKGICTDLLEKIRARESAKLLETMTRTPDQTKRLAMLERLPKIVNILWHYFIAERKAAVPIDTAVEKIIHSFNSLSTPDDVKDHLKLITETFPGWLTFIEITKGVYIQIDKKRNINEMLDNFKH